MSRARIALAFVTAFAAIALSAPAANAKPVDVTFMSRNLYLGDDLTPAIAAPPTGRRRPRPR